MPTRNGELFTLVGDHLFAVLQYVEGEPLTSALEDQPAIGTTLARAHRILRPEPGDPAGWFDLVPHFGDYLDFEPWIRPAVEQAQYELNQLAEQGLSWAELHGDPAPEAFLAQPTGEFALIDWGSSMTGPALYDVASAVMYFGGTAPELLKAYLAVLPESAAEVEVGLQAFLRFRWAVQAAYFAWRSATDVRTGLADDEDGNAAGLADARRGLGV